MRLLVFQEGLGSMKLISWLDLDDNRSADVCLNRYKPRKFYRNSWGPARDSKPVLP
jgi:hypothetical protein